MRHVSLRHAIASIAGVAASATSLALLGGACSTEAEPHGNGETGDAASDAGSAATETGTDAGDGSDEDTFACDPNMPGVLSNLKPAAPVDYVALRDQLWFDAGSRQAGDDAGLLADAGSASTGASFGTACQGATDPGACEGALASLAIASDQLVGWPTNKNVEGRQGDIDRSFLVYTRGDEVGALWSTNEVASFLGTIDTLEEARLLLHTVGMPLRCTTTPRKTGWRKNGDGSWEFLLLQSGCDGAIANYFFRASVSRDGQVQLTRQTFESAVCGRRPAGLGSPAMADDTASNPVGAYFATCAHLEAASVVAFRLLESELRALGAPRDLLDRARSSRHDEVRHAYDTTALATRFGAKVRPVEVDAPRDRSVLAIALENAREGCVFETYGALVAAFQASRASAALRPFFERIAEDEASHAALAHDVAEWLDTKLLPEERALVLAHREAAYAELRASLAAGDGDPLLRRVVGLPNAFEASLLLDGLGTQILAA